MAMLIDRRKRLMDIDLWTKRAAIGTLNHLASLLKEVA